MEKRFAFGRNWQRYLKHLDEERIQRAVDSLREMLGVDSLQGKTFLDAGCGSGLFSLAALGLGASRVHSFDYDANSVACALELRDRFFPGDPRWQVESGDVLDPVYIEKLGKWDVVYSWGVLHHTGNMWQALANAAELTAAGGELWIAIYNDQGRASRYWTWVKKTYNSLPETLRFTILLPAFIRLWGPTLMRDLLHGRPLATWKGYSSLRGMSAWEDVVDWVGGYPFEVATPEAIFDFYHQRGFSLQRLKTAGGGLGNNEFVFLYQPKSPPGIGEMHQGVF